LERVMLYPIPQVEIKILCLFDTTLMVLLIPHFPVMARLLLISVVVIVPGVWPCRLTARLLSLVIVLPQVVVVVGMLLSRVITLMALWIRPFQVMVLLKPLLGMNRKAMGLLCSQTAGFLLLVKA